jgi:hypothetical protein
LYIYRRDECRVLVGSPGGKRLLERHRRGWGIILKLIFKKWNGEARIGLLWIRIRTGGGRL